MAMWIHLLFLAFVLVVSPTTGQQSVTGGCGLALEDMPNPASDSCTAFFRCYNYRQYSLRCPLGQAFDFDRSRCRQAGEIDCPLQLQRFQAPAVPSYLRPAQAQQQREVEIRVVHVAPGVNPNNIQFYNNGRQLPVNGQPAVQGTPIFSGTSAQTNPAQSAQQFTSLRTANGQLAQGQQSQLVQTRTQSQTQGQVQGQGNLPLFVSNSALNTQSNAQSATTS